MCPRRLILLLLAPFLAAAQPADKIYHNGAVLTLDSKGTTAQAVAVRGGKVVATGADAAIRKVAGPATKLTDLKGKTLVPGFYAAHDHLPQAGSVALFQVDLNSPPIGPMRTIDDIVSALREKAGKTPKGQWVIGRGYDDTLIREKRHPNRQDLDRVSTEHPVWITHISGHLGAGNSLALSLAKITKATPQPAGGRIRIDAKTGEPDGVIEEKQGLVTRLIPGETAEQRLEAIAWCDKHYASRGVTTAVIAGGSKTRVEDLQKAAANGQLHIRVTSLMAAGGPLPQVAWLSDRLHVTGVKTWQDGSLQGYTGFLTAPYFREPEGQPDYRGYASRSRAELVDMVKKWHRAGLQVAIHGNGDAAIDDILAAFREAQREFPRPDARHRIEHCQTPREDQLDQMKELGVTPSFFEAHVYYWGDRHRDIFLGPNRGPRISPLASAKRRGIRFTLHNDTPVTPVDPLLCVWAAVNRMTTSGKVLGPDQRIGALDALRAVTSDAAWQNFEEQTKGTIEPGKLADFVILDQNPLTVPPERIKDIGILETIVGGETIVAR